MEFYSDHVGRWCLGYRLKCQDLPKLKADLQMNFREPAVEIIIGPGTFQFEGNYNFIMTFGSPDYRKPAKEYMDRQLRELGCL